MEPVVIFAEAMFTDTRFATFAKRLVMFAVDTFAVPTVSVVMLANVVLRDTNPVNVVMFAVEIFCVPTVKLVMFATLAFNVATNELLMFAEETFRILTLQLSVVTNVAIKAWCCEVPDTESVVMFAKDALRTGTVSSDTDNDVMATVPMFAYWIFAEYTFARSLTCSNPVMFALAER